MYRQSYHPEGKNKLMCGCCFVILLAVLTVIFFVHKPDPDSFKLLDSLLDSSNGNKITNLDSKTSIYALTNFGGQYLIYPKTTE